jgi:putative endonuclease
MNASFVGQGPLSLDSSYYVYILRCSDNTFYTGCTADFEGRLIRHQRGSVTATKNRRPVEVVTYTVFNGKYKAFAFEKYLKTGSGRAFMNKRLI